MKIYLAGPMSGLPDFNYPEFERVARKLRADGLDILSSHECVNDTSTPWETCMKIDMKQMLDCDAIAVLSGWEWSRGATVEMLVATLLKFKRFRVVEDTLVPLDWHPMVVVRTMIHRWFGVDRPERGGDEA